MLLGGPLGPSPRVRTSRRSANAVAAVAVATQAIAQSLSHTAVVLSMAQGAHWVKLAISRRLSALTACSSGLSLIPEINPINLSN
jgi:hypothetical protein